MTAINEQGQVYWTFEELDFEGAYDQLRLEIKENQDKVDFYLEKGLLTLSRLISDEITEQIKILLYLDRLKRGQKYGK